METIIYVDGFNLYYGALKAGSYKWLDLGKFFRLLRPADTIRNIRYFTAIVDPPSRAFRLNGLRMFGLTVS